MVSFFLDDKDICLELRQVMIVIGIGLFFFSFLYGFNFFCFHSTFQILLMFTLFFVVVMDVILIYIIYASGNEKALVETDCGEDNNILPWVTVGWLSPFVLICFVFLCCVLARSDSFYAKDAVEKTVGAECQTLLL